MEKKFTRAPWQIKHSESKSAFNVIGTNLGEKYKIARCPYVVSELTELTDRERKEAEANAKLIAAAPEMLDALDLAQAELRASYKRLGYLNSNVLTAIYNAMAKALE
jgi:hypothetical protein